MTQINMKTFAESFLNHEASAEDIDIWISFWHSRLYPEDGLAIHEFLGFTWEDYSAWIESSLSVTDILARRKADTP